MSVQRDGTDDSDSSLLRELAEALRRLGPVPADVIRRARAAFARLAGGK
jgi:hypothetical protein